MRIFIISETLTAGGAEWFSLRLAQALQQKGNEVFFFVLRADLINPALQNKFPEVKIITLPLIKTKRLVQLDRVVKKLTGKYLLIENANIKLLKKYIAASPPDVIHGHLIESDLVAVKANKNPDAHNVTTIHGDYIGNLKEEDRKKEIRFLLKNLTGIAVITEEQKRILTHYFPECSNKILKIYNGYPFPQKKYKQPDETFFYFGMIARGIPEKGWKPLIEAFSRLESKKVKLLLYGESDYLTQLKKTNRDVRIEFKGFTDDPLNAISNMHVGLLPSYFTSESLPTTVIEYLALEKPVIATNVGEVRQMIAVSENDNAGIIIDEIDEKKMVQPLYKAMKKMLEDHTFYQTKKANCKAAFEKFSMDKCVDAYIRLYKK